MEIVLQLCFENRNLLNNFDELAVEVAKMQGIKDKFKVKKDIIYFFEYYNGLDHASLLYKKLDGTKKNLALIKNRLLYIINYIDNYLLDNDSIKKYFKNQDKNELFNTMFKTCKKNTPNELFIKESINILEKNEFNPLTINDIIDKINEKYHLSLNKYSIYANLINDYSIYSLNPECDFLNDKNRDANSFIQEYNIFLKYLYNIINIQKEKKKILKNE